MNNQSLPRRQFLLGAAAATAVSLSTEAEPLPSNAHPALPKLRHSVFFWLKNPDSESDIAALIAGLKTLANIDSVKGIQIGVPASTEKRDVVDNSFQVSEMLLFDDVEGQNQYQVHPVHQKFVEECSHLWRKVVVYDSIAV
ncbi:MAG: Dabb family protein [Alteromonadaceae bacterium]|nr:Dabb family protein [Alteromonadaceae bacterium]